MIAVSERDEPALLRAAEVAPVVEAHLERHFDRGRSIVCVEAASEPGGRKVRERFAQRDDGLVGEAGEDHVLEAPHLPADRGIDARVGMPEEIHPPGTDGVDIALAVEVFEPHALGLADGDHRQVLVILHLRAGMPHVGQVTRGVRRIVGAFERHRGLIVA